MIGMSNLEVGDEIILRGTELHPNDNLVVPSNFFLATTVKGKALMLHVYALFSKFICLALAERKTNIAHSLNFLGLLRHHFTNSSTYKYFFGRNAFPSCPGKGGVIQNLGLNWHRSLASRVAAVGQGGQG